MGNIFVDKSDSYYSVKPGYNLKKWPKKQKWTKDMIEKEAHEYLSGSKSFPPGLKSFSSFHKYSDRDGRYGGYSSSEESSSSDSLSEEVSVDISEDDDGGLSENKLTFSNEKGSSSSQNNDEIELSLTLGSKERESSSSQKNEWDVKMVSNPELSAKFCIWGEWGPYHPCDKIISNVCKRLRVREPKNMERCWRYMIDVQECDCMDTSLSKKIVNKIENEKKDGSNSKYKSGNELEYDKSGELDSDNTHILKTDEGKKYLLNFADDDLEISHNPGYPIGGGSALHDKKRKGSQEEDVSDTEEVSEGRKAINNKEDNIEDEEEDAAGETQTDEENDSDQNNPEEEEDENNGEHPTDAEDENDGHSPTDEEVDTDRDDSTSVQDNDDGDNPTDEDVENLFENTDGETGDQED